MWAQTRLAARLEAKKLIPIATFAGPVAGVPDAYRILGRQVFSWAAAVLINTRALLKKSNVTAMPETTKPQ